MFVSLITIYFILSVLLLVVSEVGIYNHFKSKYWGMFPRRFPGLVLEIFTGPINLIQSAIELMRK